MEPFKKNPFSTKTIDFTKDIPSAPKEIDKKEYRFTDDEKLYAENNRPTQTKETTVIRTEPSQPDALGM